MSFLTLVERAGGRMVTGDEGRAPLSPGQVILVRGLFDDGAPAGQALAIVIKPGWYPRSYFLRFVEAQNEYWAWHLFEKAETPTPTMSFIVDSWDWSLKDGQGNPEIISAWRVIAEKDEECDLSMVPWLANVSGSTKSITIAREMLASMKEPPKATTPYSLIIPRLEVVAAIRR